MTLHGHSPVPSTADRWRLAALAWLLCMLFVAGAVAAEPRTAHRERASDPVYVAEVTRIFDGDTLWVRPAAGGRYRKLRIEGIDAPEICQAGGVASRDALERMVRGVPVTVEVRRHDKYGRALARLRVEGQDVAARLVSEGHAWSYRWQRNQGPYAREEGLARRERRGLFAEAEAEPPRQFRQRHGPCRQP